MVQTLTFCEMYSISMLPKNVRCVFQNLTNTRAEFISPFLKNG